MLKFIIPSMLLLMMSYNWTFILMSTSLMVVIFITCMMPIHTTPYIFSTFLSLDMMSFIMVALTLWITPLVVITSQKILTNNNMPSSFLTLNSILMLILIMSFTSNNIFLFYIMFEASLIPTLLIILMWGYQPERIQAGMYMMMYTITASLPLLGMISFMHNSSVDLSLMSPKFNITDSLKMSWFLLNMAFLVKLPMFFTHLWLPKAHVEAPVAGSMILAAILLKLGGYGMLRIAHMMPPVHPSIKITMMMMGLWGGMVTSLICVRQTDMKSLIAYSSVGHMSLVMAGVLSNSSWGLYGAVTMMLAHGLLSSALFAAANMVYELTSSRNLILNKGMNSILPSMTMLWFVMSAANMAAPPSINLLSEIMLITASMMTSLLNSVPLAIMSFTAAAYSLILYTSMNHGALSTSLNFLTQVNTRNLNVIFLHIIPVFALISSPSFISMW
uniref:NADH-ubiquinone oxidoreductase chain 4 n=1 Tax=Dendronereis chipolini TaxID=2860362 RepID=A0A8F7CDT0_9ANNE|nr:NADH dehydrogenase subunit 4 [Dendronereis chipolini]